MTWNPTTARHAIDRSKLTNFVREVKKLSGFEMQSGRQLALNEENVKLVSIYLSVAPRHLPGVTIKEEYDASPTRSGRHADLEGLVPKLGFANEAAMVHVESPEALEMLLEWYQYA